MAYSLTILMLSLLYLFCESEGCKTIIWLPRINSSALMNHVLHNFTNKSLDACEAACYMSDSCRSYNFNQKLELCQLSNSDHMEHPGDMGPREDFIYHGTKNTCALRPCRANQICRADNVCVCPADQPKCGLKTEVICEEGLAQLSCPAGSVIYIEWAHYGRSSIGHPCPHSADNQLCIKRENIPMTLEKVRQFCQGKISCSFKVISTAVLGFDPCPGIYKYLELRYFCM
ncbi:uncharacterized protein LOC116620140 [Nematostella vectensis]|uniref:uncharacterized protein LOC116620140 n=1 Tax=Nematostella vectensis TaxID=45351 RepID=UPI002076D9E1|nr:uncharacterized protein LOC116620140 [Nematostella vectensis]